jgi:hypothetical protein
MRCHTGETPTRVGRCLRDPIDAAGLADLAGETPTRVGCALRAEYVSGFPDGFYRETPTELGCALRGRSGALGRSRETPTEVGSTVTYHQVVKVPANTIAQGWP